MSSFIDKVNLKEPIDPDKLKIEKDDSFEMAYSFELELNKTPDYLWERYFQHEWKYSMYMLKREVSVRGNKIRVVTAPDEIEGKMDWVKGLVNATNDRVERHNEDTKKQIEREKTLKEKEKETIKKVRDKLKTN